MTGTDTPRSTVASSAIPLRTSASALATSLHQEPHHHHSLPHHRYTHPSVSHPYDAHNLSSPASAASSMRESPSSSYHYSQNNHHHPQQPQRPQQDYLYSSSLPADSFPRTFSQSAPFDQESYSHQQPANSSSFTQPPQQRHYQLHNQPSYLPVSSKYDEPRSLSDIGANSRSNNNNGATQSNSFSNISSNLPEYSYPMAPSQKLYKAHHRPFHLEQSQVQHMERSLVYHKQTQGHLQEPHGQAFHTHPKDRPNLQQQQLERRHFEFPEQQAPSVHRLRPPIRTTWPNDASRDCPPRYQSGSSQQQNTRSTDNRISSVKPRFIQVAVPILRSSVTEPYAFSESPIDYHETNSFRHTMSSSIRSKYRHEDNEMLSYSEQGNVFEFGSEDNEENKYDGSDAIHIKKQKMNSGGAMPFSYDNTMPPRILQSNHGQKVDTSERFEIDGQSREDERKVNLTSTSSSRKQNQSGDMPIDDRSPTKGRKAKAPSQKRVLHHASSLGEALDQIEDEAQTGGTASSARGLRIYAQRVCERVQAKGSTSYNELVIELCGGNASENTPEVPEGSAQENIRRRVYDALNVLEAAGIIAFFENKDIRWVGIDDSPLIRDASRLQPLVPSRLPEGGRDDESEEPEDDDMDIEQLQREIQAMKLQNELERAKLQDQITRQVQLVGLVKRNKHKEARDEEREVRRRQRKEEKRRARAADEDSSMADVGPQCSSDQNDETRYKTERHRRKKSSRQTSERAEGQEVEAGIDDLENDPVEDEESRRRRKKERRERRERKVQQKLEKQSRIQLPFVVMRLPGYTGQSSDSESSISVVRRVRGRQTSNQSNEHGESTDQETTMVEIQIPQKEEPIIMSDTEILGDLGFNTLTIDELESILPKDFINSVQYTVNTEEHRQSPYNQQCAQLSDADMRHSGDDSVMVVDEAAGATSVTIQGGFEREFVRAASEGHSSVG